MGEEGEAGRVDKKEWGGEGETGGGQWGEDWEGGMEGGNLKGEMGRGATGRGRREEGGKGRGRRRGKGRGHFTDGYEHMGNGMGIEAGRSLNREETECLGQ